MVASSLAGLRSPRHPALFVVAAALLALAATPARAADATAPATQPTVSSPGLCAGPAGTALKDGKAYRGVGVNYFDAFARTLRDGNDTSYDAGLAKLAEHGIPFARFMACGFWPADWGLYQRDRREYFRRLDGVVRSAERRGVGLIPSLFWHTATVPDLVGEPLDAWGDPDSKTHAFMRMYAREVVTRYRDSRAVWAWEFGNEYNLPADLPNAAEHRPPCWPKLGTPATRSSRDELTRPMIRAAFAAFAHEVRKHDPHRPITTGDSMIRASAWHQRAERSWKPDTLAQQIEILLGDHPGPIEMISVHIYRDASRLDPASAAARQSGKVLFVGEFGVSGPPTDASRAAFAAMCERIVQSPAALAALWVYDYKNQKEWNATFDNDRAWQLQAVEDLNAQLRKSK